MSGSPHPGLQRLGAAVDLFAHGMRVLLGAPSYAETTAGIQKLRDEVSGALSVVAKHDGEHATIAMDVEARLQALERQVFELRQPPEPPPEPLITPNFSRFVTPEEIKAALTSVLRRHPAVR